MLFSDAEWPEALLNHRMTCEETADTCLKRRKARQREWEQLVAQTLHQAAAAAAGNSAPLNPSAGAAKPKQLSDMNDSIASVEEWQALEGSAAGFRTEDTYGADGVNTAPSATAAGSGMRPSLEYLGPVGGGGGMGVGDGRGSMDGGTYGGLLLGDAGDAAGLLSWRQQVLFRGMRVRMSVATGYVDSVRVHSVTKRREYTGDVLNKVQALGEAPQGGQVSRLVCQSTRPTALRGRKCL